ncbi:hypothetical protein KC323_g5284 [Hortaea werneckii]|nr:hypothetical protein KC323_g5284 [Hortaea werneckii]
MADNRPDIAKALGDIVSAQLNDVKAAMSNPIKAKYGNALYNFLIIDPDLVNDNFDFHYGAARGEAEAAEAALADDLQGNLDSEGYLALPTLRKAYHPGNLDTNAPSSLHKPGRRLRGTVVTHLDEAAKDIIENVLAI